MSILEVSPWKRLVAYIADLFVAIIFANVFFMIFYPISVFMDMHHSIVFVYPSVGVLLGVLYFLLKDSLFEGMSFGKATLGLQVVDSKDKVCTWWRSIVRNFTMLVPILNLFEIFMTFIRSGERLGDTLAGTKVRVAHPVEKRSYFAASLLIIFFFISLLATIIYGSYSFNTELYDYVYMEPQGEFTENQVLESIGLLSSRSQIIDSPIQLKMEKQGKILIRSDDSFLNNYPALRQFARRGLFLATISNTQFFSGGADVESVCTDPDCSGIDANEGCVETSIGWTCRTKFRITLKDEAANRFSDITSSIPVVEKKPGFSYLNKTIKLTIDDEPLEELNITPDLKGKIMKEFWISQSTTGRTKEEASLNALRDMFLMQHYLKFGPLPIEFKLE